MVGGLVNQKAEDYLNLIRSLPEKAYLEINWYLKYNKYFKLGEDSGLSGIFKMCLKYIMVVFLIKIGRVKFFFRCI